MTGATPLVLAVPSKGRLMDKARALFEAAGLTIRKTGDERGYRGRVEGLQDVEVAFFSADEIAYHLRSGRAHMGVTGEDLVRERIPDADARVDLIAPLGFGHADVVVAVPDAWIDVAAMVDLEAAAAQFARLHGRRMRVATKYHNLTRRFFDASGVTAYRIVESLGATEGAPAAGMAEVIVDITSTGATLRANHLRILQDGVILRSQANLVLSHAATWTPAQTQARDQIATCVRAALAQN